MTVRLLVPYNGLPAGSVVSGYDDDALISAGKAVGVNEVRLLAPFAGVPAGALISNIDSAFLDASGLGSQVSGYGVVRDPMFGNEPVTDDMGRQNIIDSSFN